MLAIGCVFTATRPHCLTKLTMNDPGALILNGSSFRNKPVDGITIAAWLNLQPVGKIHTIFSVINADDISEILVLKLFYKFD